MASASADFIVSPSGAVSSVPPENNDGVMAEAVVNFPGLEWFPAGVPWPEVAKSPVSHDRL